MKPEAKRTRSRQEQQSDPSRKFPLSGPSLRAPLHTVTGRCALGAGLGLRVLCGVVFGVGPPSASLNVPPLNLPGSSAPASVLPPEAAASSAGDSSAERDREILDKVSAAAIERTRHRVVYDGSYVGMDYPGGDVPDNRGVCSDVVVRAYRTVGVDLQKEVHEDMSTNFASYPQEWGLKRPDSNIDHRRVGNLMTFFERHGASVAIARDGNDYLPGDIVAWRLPQCLHIGVVVDRKDASGKRPKVVHNYSCGPVLDDFLFRYKIVGHYRYAG
jgi:uncharacterized protein YijF (DUF1287 family)